MCTMNTCNEKKSEFVELFVIRKTKPSKYGPPARAKIGAHKYNLLKRDKPGSKLLAKWRTDINVASMLSTIFVCACVAGSCWHMYYITGVYISFDTISIVVFEMP